MGYPLECLDKVQEDDAIGQPCSGRRFAADGLLPCCNVSPFADTRIEEAAALCCLPLCDEVPSRPHPDPRQEREEPDGAEAAIGFGEEDHHGKMVVARPAASPFTLMKNIDEFVNHGIGQPEEGSGVQGIPPEAR